MEFNTVTFQSANNGARMPGEVLTVREAARRAGVTQTAIVRWIRNGYLSATPSPNGWQIPADQLDQAQAAANDARGTGPVPRRMTPSLVPAPTPIRRSIEQRASVASSEDIGEQIVAPLAELIRDQIEVVHDQAEVIGWLQAERERLTAELEYLQRSRATGQPLSTAFVSQRTEAHQLYDEVLSLLWKKDDEPNGEDTLELEEPAPAISHERDDWLAAELFSTTETDTEVEPTAVAGIPEEPAPEVEAAEEVPVEDELPALQLEDYADPSWFFGIPNERYGPDEATRPRPTLQPITPRTSQMLGSTSGDDDDLVLHQMIDETERKIAELWRAQEELRVTSPRANEMTLSAAQRASTGWRRFLPLRRG